MPGRDGSMTEQIYESYPWLFLNHSCIPNAMIRDCSLFAIQPISPFEEITFDYNTTEYDMVDPFICRCGKCNRRRIRGFRYLTDDEGTRLLPYLAEHLRRNLNGRDSREI
jgi:hypothetical protein